jgi:glycyl-tRNA synthetase
VEVPAETLEEAGQFVLRRLEQSFLEAGFPVGHVRAVLELGDAPELAERTLEQLGRLDGTDGFRALTEAVQRVRRIVPAGSAAAGYQAALFREPAEHALAAELERIRELLAGDTGLERFAAAAPDLVAAITVFFDDVLVNAEDPAVRANRIGLLVALRDLAEPVLAWAELG